MIKTCMGGFLCFFFSFFNIICTQVQQKHEDEEKLARAISQKLLDVPGVSFSEIASQALEHGRKQLAIRV